MPWFKVDDTFAFHPKALAASNSALGLWVRAGSWCAANLTGGHVPRHMVGTLGAQKRDAARLVDAGLWRETDDGYLFHGWDEFQPSKADIEAERAANRERQRRYRAAQRGSETSEDHGNSTADAPQTHRSPTADAPQPNTRGTFTAPQLIPVAVDDIGAIPTETGDRHGVSHGVSNGVSNDPPSHPIPSSLSSSAKPADQKNDRPDIHALCKHLSDRLTANEVKHKISEKWRTEARLLIDRDERDPQQAHDLIDWATSDAFWKANIRSMPTFRDKYDQLRLKADAERPATPAAPSQWDTLPRAPRRTA